MTESTAKRNFENWIALSAEIHGLSITLCRGGCFSSHGSINNRCTVMKTR